jgi:hypothetical protein
MKVRGEFYDKITCPLSDVQKLALELVRCSGIYNMYTQMFEVYEAWCAVLLVWKAPIVWIHGSKLCGALFDIYQCQPETKDLKGYMFSDQWLDVVMTSDQDDLRSPFVDWWKKNADPSTPHVNVVKYALFTSKKLLADNKYVTSKADALVEISPDAPEWKKKQYAKMRESVTYVPCTVAGLQDIWVNQLFN